VTSREVVAGDRRSVVVVLGKGDDPVEAITTAVRQHGIRAAQVTGVGGFRSVRLGFFDRARKAYEPIEVDEQVEVLSLLGDIAVADGETVVHAHAVLGRRNGSTVGGHLLAGEVWPTLEVIVTEVAPELARRTDPETGLALIHLDGHPDAAGR